MSSAPWIFSLWRFSSGNCLSVFQQAVPQCELTSSSLNHLVRSCMVLRFNVAASVCLHEMHKLWTELNQYNIYNTDEMGLYYITIPNHSNMSNEEAGHSCRAIRAKDCTAMQPVLARWPQLLDSQKYIYILGLRVRGQTSGMVICDRNRSAVTGGHSSNCRYGLEENGYRDRPETIVAKHGLAIGRDQRSALKGSGVGTSTFRRGC